MNFGVNEMFNRRERLYISHFLREGFPITLAMYYASASIQLDKGNYYYGIELSNEFFESLKWDELDANIQRKHRRADMLHKQGRIRTLPRKPKEKIYTRKTKTHSYRDAWGENERFNINTLRQPQMWDGRKIVRKRTAKLARLR